MTELFLDGIYDNLITKRDWPEDFDDENGNYLKKCIRCGNIFKGYKRRAICKICSSKEKVSTTISIREIKDENDTRRT
jgi:rRNA maturation endonuclease Nob1